MTNIKFGLGQREWEGPTVFEFRLHSPHSKTVRHTCQLKEHAFDFYAPLFLLHVLSPDTVPDRLQVAIGKSFQAVQTMGFLSEPLPLRIESEACEYEVNVPKVNSIRYDFTYEGQTYALYIPNEVFEGHPHPRRVYMEMAVLSDE